MKEIQDRQSTPSVTPTLKIECVKIIQMINGNVVLKEQTSLCVFIGHIVRQSLKETRNKRVNIALMFSTAGSSLGSRLLVADN